MKRRTLNSKAEWRRIERQRERDSSFFVTKILVSHSVLAHSGSDAFAKCFLPSQRLLARISGIRKISPWTCTINDPPRFFSTDGFVDPASRSPLPSLSIRRRIREPPLLKVFSHEPVKLCGNGSWIGKRGERVDKTRCRKETNRPTEMPRRALLVERVDSPSLPWSCIYYHLPLNLGIWNFAVAELFDSILFTKGKGRKGGKRISNLLRTRFVKRVNLAFIFNSCDNNLWAVVFQRLHEINWSSFNPFSVYIFP